MQPASGGLNLALVRNAVGAASIRLLNLAPVRNVVGAASIRWLRGEYT